MASDVSLANIYEGKKIWCALCFYIEAVSLIHGLEDRAIGRLGNWYGVLGCRGVMGKYWNGYNIYFSWILTCLIWIMSVV